MYDISSEQINIQNKFLKNLDLYCILKFIITNNIEIYNEESYNVLINLVKSNKIITVEESKRIFSNNKKLFKRYMYKKNKRRPCQINNTHNIDDDNNNNNNILKNYSPSEIHTDCANICNDDKKMDVNQNLYNKEIYTNDSLFSKDLNNKILFEFFQFPESTYVSEYINNLCKEKLIHEPLNINLSLVKFDKKKKKSKKRKTCKRNNIGEMQTSTNKYNSDSGIGVTANRGED